MRPPATRLDRGSTSGPEARRIERSGAPRRRFSLYSCCANVLWLRREAGMDDFFAANRLNWADRAKLHSTDTTGAYRIADVLAGEPRAGRSGRDRRRRRAAADPPAVPYRPRHDQPRP